MIIPSSRYPTQIDITDLTNYPQGKARNVVATGDLTGTPFEKNLVNDWFGFQQAAIAAAGITPSGSPDTAVNSQLLTAIQTLAATTAVQRPIGVYLITPNVAKNSSQIFNLSLSFQQGGFILASDSITVPTAGRYRVSFSGQAQTTDTGTASRLKAEIQINNSGTGVAGVAYRYSTNTAETPSIEASGVFNITAPGSMPINLVSLQSPMNFAASTVPMLIVERVG